MGMKIPKMKQSGRTVADMTGWTASALLIGVAAAKPRQQNAAAPAMVSRTKAGAVLLGDERPVGGPADGQQDDGHCQGR